MEIFNYLKAITETKEDLDFNNEEVRKDYQNYMINRFISMCELYIPICNEVNKFDIPKDMHFKYYQSALPKRKSYFKYIKKPKDLSDDEKLIIANYFQVGKKDADKYIQILEENQLKEILDIFKYGKK